MKYSLIVPVFNRPEEVEELLQSCTQQTFTDFEVVIVEDGSTNKCDTVCDTYKSAGSFELHYFCKDNSGPGQSRNYGAARARGEYLIVLDSDVVLPPTYLEEVDKEIQTDAADAFGGSDKAHESFTDIQKAINYSMTSFFTTGGIRGGKKKLDKFYPRSFNMGIRADVYKALGGFSKMRFGEDIDFSIRIFKNGYRCRLFPDAWVWHKRRTDIKKFFRQVFNSGIARINLYKKYPESLKLVHLLPAVFTLGVCLLVLASATGRVLMAYAGGMKWYWLAATPWLPIVFFALVIFLDSTIRNKSLKIGFYSIATAFVQLMGYGFGFLSAWWKRCVCKKDEYSAFNETFYRCVL